MSDTSETPESAALFDFGAYPPDTLFYDRRSGVERRDNAGQARRRPKSERRNRPERRKRIDPTTFEKQYTACELEFMNAMQHFKIQSGKSFPSHGDVLRVAYQLGYRKVLLNGPATLWAGWRDERPPAGE
jgi:hypothetical protein